MNPHRLALCLGALLCLAACGEDDPLPPPSQPTTGGGGGEGGSAPGGGGAGGEGGATPPGCGDGILDEGEACDGDELGGVTCIGLGYEWGTPTCQEDCTLSEATCYATEVCYDGLDNDGDGDGDCDDDECTASCSNACASPPALVDPVIVSGTLDGHGSLLASSCTSGLAPDGGEIAFAVTAAVTGVLEVDLASDENLVVSVRSACTDLESELACANGQGPAATEHLSIPVATGETVIVVVEGYSDGDAGAFTLSVESHAVVCGDGKKDPVEGCDDGNTSDGDGCDALCIPELTELEPNDDPTSASPMTDPFVGEISPAGDVDYVEVTIANGPASLVVEAYDVDGSCAAMTADSYLEIWDADGTVLLAADDDSGEGFCAKVAVGGLDAGKYLVRVSASPFDAGATFPYFLTASVQLDLCGDGVKTVAEQCDDANLTNGDGCSSTCGFELTESEPNHNVPTSDTFVSPWVGEITEGDHDLIKVTVPGGQSMSIQVTDLGTGTCIAGLLDSYLELYGTNGTSLLQADDDTGVGYCSYLETTVLPAGTYYLRVSASPFDPLVSFFYGLQIQMY